MGLKARLVGGNRVMTPGMSHVPMALSHIWDTVQECAPEQHKARN